MRRFLLSATVLALCLLGAAQLHGVQLSRPHSPARVEPKCSLDEFVQEKARAARAASEDDQISLKTLISPFAYMDEVFHLPQGLQYGLTDDFASWDPMITTPPGAYVGAFTVGRAARALKDYADIDLITVANVVTASRAANGVFVFLSFLFAWRLFGDVERALCTFLFPPTFFFTMLYYTDPSATLALVLMTYLYVRCVRRQPHRASKYMILVAAAGLWGVSIRQTMIVWVFYLGAHRVLVDGLFRYESDSADPSRRRFGKKDRWLQHIGRSIVESAPLIVVGLLFVAFLIWNEGAIVLGDRTNHVPVLHWAQIPYFFASVFAFSPFFTLQRVRQLRWSSLSTWFVCAVALGVFVVCLDQGAHFHKYILADNRHYTAVLYRYVLQHRVSRCAIAIPALLGFLRAHPGLLPIKADRAPHLTRQSITAEVIFFVCLVVCLVPQGLIEFRYLAAPMFLVLVHDERRVPWVASALDAAWMGLINFVTMYIFLNRPFTAPDGTVGRFMW